MEDECWTCAEGVGFEGECPESKRRCGHHCNCVWVHDCCHWCGAEVGEDGELIPTAVPSEFDRVLIPDPGEA